MTINGILAQKEDVIIINGIETYEMELVTTSLDVGSFVPPFVIRTDTGDVVDIDTARFTVLLHSNTDWTKGITTVIFGIPDERELRIAALEEQLEAEQAFSAMLTTTQMLDLSHMVAADVTLPPNYKKFINAADGILDVAPPPELAPRIQDWYSRGIWTTDQVDVALALGQISKDAFAEIVGVR